MYSDFFYLVVTCIQMPKHIDVNALALTSMKLLVFLRKRSFFMRNKTWLEDDQE